MRTADGGRTRVAGRLGIAGWSKVREVYDARGVVAASLGESGDGCPERTAVAAGRYPAVLAARADPKWTRWPA